MDVFDLFAKISLDTSGFSEGLDRAGEMARSFGTAAEQGLRAVEGIGEKAGGVWNGAAEEMAAALTGGLRDAVGELEAWLTENSGQLAGAGSDIADKIFGGFRDAEHLLPEYIGDLAAVIADTVLSCHDALFAAGDKLLGAIGEGMTENREELQGMASGTGSGLAGGLAEGITAALPELLAKVPEIMAGLGAAFIEAMPELSSAVAETGAAAVDGIWQGIQSAAGQFRENVKDFFGGVVDGVKDLLGIHSPSRVFAGIGENMAAGLGEGWEREFGRVRSQIEDGLDFGSASVGVEARGSYGVQGSAYGGAANANQTRDIVINLTAELDGGVLARKMVRHNARAETLVGGSMVTVSR